MRARHLYAEPPPAAEVHGLALHHCDFFVAYTSLCVKMLRPFRSSRIFAAARRLRNFSAADIKPPFQGRIARTLAVMLDKRSPFARGESAPPHVNAVRTVRETTEPSRQSRTAGLQTSVPIRNS